MAQQSWMPFDCYVVERHTSQSAKCKDCGWEDDVPKDNEYRANDMISLAIAHVRETGHTVERKYGSRYLYSGQPTDKTKPPEPTEKPRRKVYCNDCKKWMAENAKGIVVFWAASSHHKKTGHHVDIIGVDGKVEKSMP